SSSDGQRFRAGGRGESTGHVNPKYGSEPGRLFYTHISDQYAPFSTRVVNVGVRDSTYVLDGLLYHESDLRIEEHYTDTAGFTDHVPHPPMVSASGLAAGARAPGTSTRSTAASRGGCF
ncbi:Tn3 family transposase, partial [Escherichia coli]